MILDELFDRIVVLSLARCPERGERAMGQLRERGLSEHALLTRAIDGKICQPSDWWPTGPSAWGCMMSHYLSVIQALNDGVESLLVIEDDCVWQDSAAAMVSEFMSQVPADWGQVYLGGQHRGPRPEWMSGRPAVLKAASVHRTHCYGISRKAMPAFLKHIIYAPDYEKAKSKDDHRMHVDHQLERAHRRGDWPVYAMAFWAAGQGENVSTINGRDLPDQWWHWSWQECHRRLPLIVARQEDLSLDQARWLHFGSKDHRSPVDTTIDTGVEEKNDAGSVCQVMEVVAHEAFQMQRLPAIHAWPEKVQWLRERWLGPVLALPPAQELARLCAFPESGVIRHPWLNPEVGQGLDLTQSEAADHERDRQEESVPQVHQIWLGGKEFSPRLQAYCDRIRLAFPGWTYRLWRDEDLPELLDRALLPALMSDPAAPVGMRADLVRLEILRQRGGIYLDIDFEPLKDDLRSLFPSRTAFYYADQRSGSPANGLIGAIDPGNAFVEGYLRRAIAGMRPLDNVWETIDLTGPGRMKQCLQDWVGDWNRNEAFVLDGQQVGCFHAGGSIIRLWQETVYPYFHDSGITYATFDAAAYPQAWLAHHWEASWVPKE